ncbi:wax ester/triacylglycerol synthase family O-acyltransferase [Sphingomonas tabacisoli]|uniref:diacylglycerol O-acyltransferase n=1 Tax=Sphingomonas tabacisoli TaxID=2249466 RepID=A0ABW4I5I6_9SPHN
MRQLSMADAIFVMTERPARNTQHIGMVFVFDPSTASGKITFEDVLELHRRRMPLSRSFREKLVRVPMDLDYPYWINDDSFDLEYHVRHTAVPQPATRKEFFAVVNQLMSQPLDMARPLWESWFVEGLDAVDGIPPGSFALLIKMHHAAVDGISGMEMVTALLEDEETAAARTPKGPWQGEAIPDPQTLMMKAIGASWTSPLKLGEALMRAMPKMAENRNKVKSGAAIKPGKAKAPKTRFNGPVTPHRVLEGRNFAFAEVKALKDAIPGATVNDIVLGVVGGSLRRYLTAKDELPDTSLVVTVPISIRTPEQAETGGNQLSLTMIAVRTDLADPVERVKAVGASMRAVKDYNKAIGAGTLASVTAAMPGMLLGVAMRAMTALPANDLMMVSNAMVTNVPGPMTPMTLLGARYVAGFAAGPSTDGLGLIHAITSMSGMISIGFSACREMLPDPEFYGQCIEESYNELRDAVLGSSKPRRKARTARQKPA